MPAIAALYAEAVRTGTASFETEPPDEAEMTIRMARLISGGFPYLVADDPLHGVLGYAYAGPYRDAAGLSLDGGEFGLCAAGNPWPRYRPGAAQCDRA